MLLAGTEDEVQVQHCQPLEHLDPLRALGRDQAQHQLHVLEAGLGVAGEAEAEGVAVYAR